MPWIRVQLYYVLLKRISLTFVRTWTWRARDSLDWRRCSLGEPCWTFGLAGMRQLQTKGVTLWFVWWFLGLHLQARQLRNMVTRENRMGLQHWEMWKVRQRDWSARISESHKWEEERKHWDKTRFQEDGWLFTRISDNQTKMGVSFQGKPWKWCMPCV